MNVAISTCSSGHAKAISKVSHIPYSETNSFLLSMMAPWVRVLLCVIISGDPETIFHSLSKVYCPCLQFTSLILWNTCKTTHGICLEKMRSCAPSSYYDVMVWLIFSSIHSDMLPISCKKYKIAFLRFTFILISQILNTL